MSVTRKEVYEALDGERSYQDRIWPLPDHLHSVTEFLVYIEDYVNEAKHVVTREPDVTANRMALHALRKIGAMCVAAMEQHGAPQRMGTGEIVVMQ